MNKLIIYNTSEIITCKSEFLKSGKMMSDIGAIYNSAIYVEDNIIKDIDNETDIISKYGSNDVIKYDCKGSSVVPGFIDSHTHFVFGGYREDEFYDRISGLTYQEIMAKGGGISKTVDKTRIASKEELISKSLLVLDSMLSYGITSIEGKSGYGLDFETEIKQLEVMKALNELQPIEIINTYLGAHSIPTDESDYYHHDSKKYIEFIIDKVLPYVRVNKLASFVDIFIEKGVFSIEEGKHLLESAKEMGFKIKVHADELSYLGGANLAASLNATSAEHLLYTKEQDMKQMAKNNVIACLLPLTAFNLKEQYANGRKFIDNGCAITIASDYNPGSCFSENIALAFLLSNLYMGLTVEEALNAITINASFAIGREKEIGSIEIGKQADILVLDYPSYKFIPYHLGVSSIRTVFKNGKIVKERRV